MKPVREAKARSRAVVPLKKKKKATILPIILNKCETWSLTLKGRTQTDGV
jgi:hypothetical protein